MNRAQRIQAFQLHADAEYRTLTLIHVVRRDVGHRVAFRHRGTVEYLEHRKMWEAQRDGGHVGLFKYAGPALNALWELDPWDISDLKEVV